MIDICKNCVNYIDMKEHNAKYNTNLSPECAALYTSQEANIEVKPTDSCTIHFKLKG